MNDDPIEQRLAELARRTNALRASAGFRERVLLTIASRTDLRSEIVRSSRRFAAMAALVAERAGLPEPG